MNKNKDEFYARDLISQLLTYLGENTNRDGLIETPKRVIEMYKELFSGYSQDISSLYKIFDSNGYNELVTVANINFYSLCEHHMIPFYGKVHIGYIPNGKVLGLSKFARLVDAFSRRLQTQENLTKQLADSIENNLLPKGLIVNIEAEHLCVNMRGVKKNGFLTKTTIKRGVLNENNALVDQFYRDINLKESQR